MLHKGICAFLSMLTLGCTSDTPNLRSGDSTASEAPADLQATNIARQLDSFAETHGALGYYWDSSANVFVVVFPSNSALPTTEHVSQTIGSKVRFEQRAMTRSSYDEMVALILNRDFHSEAKRYTYATDLDIRTGKLVLTTDAPRNVLQPILDRYPAEINIHYGRISNVPASNPGQ